MENSFQVLVLLSTALVACGIVLLVRRHMGLKRARNMWRLLYRSTMRRVQRTRPRTILFLGTASDARGPVQTHRSDAEGKRNPWAWLERIAILFALITGGTAFYWQWEERKADDREDIVVLLSQLVQTSDSQWVAAIDVFNRGKKPTDIRALYSEERYRIASRQYSDTIMVFFDHSKDPVNIATSTSKRFQSQPIDWRAVEAIMDTSQRLIVQTGRGRYFVPYDMEHGKDILSLQGWRSSQDGSVRRGVGGFNVGITKEMTEDVINWTSQISLETNPNVLTVSPNVRIDPLGGFLIADTKQSRVFLYSPSGALKSSFGSEGQGSGKFERPISAARLPNHKILVLELAGRLTILDSAGATAMTVQLLPFDHIYDFDVVNDSMIIVSGTRNVQEPPTLIHLWDIKNARLVTSFFGLKVPHRNLTSAYKFTGFTDVAVRGDTVAVSFSLSDTLHVLRLNGERLENIVIPTKRFRPLRKPLPIDNANNALQDWLESFSTLSQLYWAADGSFYVQYFDTRARTPLWRLVHMDRRGNLRFELVDTPELLTVSQSDNSLVFLHPSSIPAGGFSIARMTH